MIRVFKLAFPRLATRQSINSFSSLMPKVFATVLAGIVLCSGVQCAWADPTATVTTLAVTSSGSAVTTVPATSVVTLTAVVTASGLPVSPGTVNFCDASALGEACTDIHRIGTAQLTSAGTAVVRFIPGVGNHSYHAVFVGASCNTSCAHVTYSYLGSSSNASWLSVTGVPPTVTTIAQSGSAGNYSLTGTIGFSTASPGGTVSFLDTSNANYPLATVPLTAATAGLSILNSSTLAVNGSLSTYYEDFNPVAVGDINGDGIPDLAIIGSASTSGANGSITVLLGAGNGLFLSAGVYQSGNGPGGIVIADFNGDGVPDLAVSNSGDNTVTVLLGNGDGTFQTKGTSQTGISPGQLAVGDFNGDGILDIVTANVGNSNTGNCTVTVLLGNGDGTFQIPETLQASNNPTAHTVVVGDFNADGISDLAVSSDSFFSNSGSVTVLFGKGDGTFQAPTTVDTETGATPGAGIEVPAVNAVGLVIGDFNVDGIPDLAVTNANYSTVLLGNGDGSFKAMPHPSTLGSDNPIVVGDFNGDGIPDLAEENFDRAYMLLGNGDGTFQQLTVPIPNTNYTTYIHTLAVGDFNGDGITDLVADLNSGNPTILLTLSSQTVTASVSRAE